MRYLKLTITFLNGTYHGCSDQGQPEWPPSPMRVFQALVGTTSQRFGDPLPDNAASALDWLATLPPPLIETPPHRTAMPIRTSVPNNAMDICAKAWSRGSYDAKDAKPSTHKAMKTIAPTVLDLDDPERQRVTYLWSVDPHDNDSKNASQVIADLTRRLVCVGWGLDLVAAHAELAEVDENGSADSAQSPSISRWEPSPRYVRRLRVANENSRVALHERHAAFLKRLSTAALQPVPALRPSAYQTIGYGRAWESSLLPFVAFSLIETDGSRFASFPNRNGIEVAGMLRYAVRNAAEAAGWNEQKIARIVLGHGEQQGEVHQSVNLDRFAFVPLPSLEPRRKGGRADHVGMIRRVLIYAPTTGFEQELQWVRRALSGAELIDERTKLSVAMLSAIPASDKVVKRYLAKDDIELGAEVWSTVSPMVLPRNYMRRQDIQRLNGDLDAEAKRQALLDRDDRIESIIRKAIVHAGFSETLSTHALIDWSNVGFWPGAMRNNDYFIPAHLRKFPTLHVRITWRDPQGELIRIPGPVVLGAGRFFGLGLFAADAIAKVWE